MPLSASVRASTSGVVVELGETMVGGINKLEWF